MRALYLREAANTNAQPLPPQDHEAYRSVVREFVQRHVVQPHAEFFQDVVHGLFYAPNRRPEHGCSIHAEHMPALGDGIGRGWHPGPAGLHPDEPMAGAIGVLSSQRPFAQNIVAAADDACIAATWFCYTSRWAEIRC